MLVDIMCHIRMKHVTSILSRSEKSAYLCRAIGEKWKVQDMDT